MFCLGDELFFLFNSNSESPARAEPSFKQTYHVLFFYSSYPARYGPARSPSAQCVVYWSFGIVYGSDIVQILFSSNTNLVHRNTLASYPLRHGVFLGGETPACPLFIKLNQLKVVVPAASCRPSPLDAIGCIDY